MSPPRTATRRPCLGAVLLALALAGAARAGPWEAVTAQGLVLRIGQDSTRSRDAYVLSREYPDGRPDAGFGQGGSLLFALGPDNEGPAALRVDSLGRAWVAGATAGTGQAAQAVVMRFLPHGVPDAAYANGGRSVSAPGGGAARALDLMPLADGSAVVVGQLLDARGQERVGWWRLGPDGSVDPRSGLGPLWQDGGSAAAEQVALALGADGSVALGLRRAGPPGQALELWVLAADGTPPQRVSVRADAPEPQLQQRDGRWVWVSRGVVLPQGDVPPLRATPTASAAAVPAQGGVQAASAAPSTPQAPAAPVVPAASAVAPESRPPGEAPADRGVWLAGLLLAALALAIRPAWRWLHARL